MSTVVFVLRAFSVLAFALPMLLLGLRRQRRPSKARAHQHGCDWAPLVANLAAFGLFFPSLPIFSSSSESSIAPLLALSGCMVALAGVGLVVRSRAELGPAWSLLATADRDTGLVTTGPYGFVRHPIYLGLTLLAMGEALAFGSWVAIAVVVSGIVPTFAWRAHVEERLLAGTFGERFTSYRRRTKTMIPYVF
jgi:protein-S-isoprenylcysteine O-methyltransferase Ste14